MSYTVKNGKLVRVTKEPRKPADDKPAIRNGFRPSLQGTHKIVTANTMRARQAMNEDRRKTGYVVTG